MNIRNKLLQATVVVVIAGSLISGGLFALISAINNQESRLTPVPDDTITLSFVNNRRSEKHSLELEIANTPEALTKGLMGRQSLPSNGGMFFVFDRPLPLTFWMKDTLISLDIIFLDSDLNVVTIYKSVRPNQTEETYPASAYSQYVIETNAGWTTLVDLRESDQFFIE